VTTPLRDEVVTKWRAALCFSAELSVTAFCLKSGVHEQQPDCGLGKRLLSEFHTFAVSKSAPIAVGQVAVTSISGDHDVSAVNIHFDFLF